MFGQIEVLGKCTPFDKIQGHLGQRWPCLEAQLKLKERHLRFLLYFRTWNHSTKVAFYFCKTTLSSVEAVCVAAIPTPKGWHLSILYRFKLITVKHRNNGHLNNGMHQNNGQSAYSGASKLWKLIEQINMMHLNNGEFAYDGFFRYSGVLL